MLDKEKFAKIVGENIRKLRKDKGWDQEGFARHAEIDRAYYGYIERGLNNVTVYMLYKISIALDVPITDLLTKIK